MNYILSSRRNHRLRRLGIGISSYPYVGLALYPPIAFKAQRWSEAGSVLDRVASSKHSPQSVARFLEMTLLNRAVIPRLSGYVLVFPRTSARLQGYQVWQVSPLSCRNVVCGTRSRLRVGPTLIDSAQRRCATQLLAMGPEI